MPDRPVAAGLRSELEYLRELGWQELDLHSEPVGTSVESVTSTGPAAPDDRAGAAEVLAGLEREASSCTACALAETRTKVVFGSGGAGAELFLIGEGPGANEDRQGVPFVGAAGELLTKILEAIELSRDEVYIANVVKCRPPGNRDPRPEEVAACVGFLREQIRLIRPKLLVALGRVAAQTLLGCTAPIGRLRGSWEEFEGVPLRVTYHPAALLRNAGLKRPTWEDMQAVRDRLQEM